ncbi:hypothetical protein HBI26_253640 [Parastagonospora nodorum]|nr:hypothetical protein HBI28_251870 [Parastagonospora nodorum]KAH5547680.1 hypothetical protein HBI26_253640 [Parastagonospora nodorum]KAH5617574.1 hypothetical protein HBI22_252550 [Parastagonospora nodorum]KAH5705543.1 hypothetical protein HBI18_254540 [Parastagonospora nodorum]
MVTLSVVQRSGQTLLAVAALIQYSTQRKLSKGDGKVTEYGRAEGVLKALTGTVGLTKIRSKNFVSREVAYEYASHRGFAALIDRVDQILDKNSAPRKALRQGLTWSQTGRNWPHSTDADVWERHFNDIRTAQRGWPEVERVPMICWQCRIVFPGQDSFNRHQLDKH